VRPDHSDCGGDRSENPERVNNRANVEESGRVKWTMLHHGQNPFNHVLFQIISTFKKMFVRQLVFDLDSELKISNVFAMVMIVKA
jgi:hypothetical protein